MTTETLTCNACGWAGTEPVIESSGPHWKASCPECGKYIKFVSQGDAPSLYFGKYAGRTLADVKQENPAYLRWLADNTKQKKLKKQIEEELGK